MKVIRIVGAGQLGSRHLQALQAVETPLDIEVIDPSEASLATAKERFEAVAGHANHRIRYSKEFAQSGATDIAIIATNADHRRSAVESLLAATEVRHLILEKLLFVERQDYETAGQLMERHGVSAWVNCPMRIMPCYEEIRQAFGGRPIQYRVTGSQFGLVTNAIHYLDHVAYLTGCDSFTVDTSGLSKEVIAAKRRGFLELNGTLAANFGDGSRCDITCYAQGDAPVLVEIFNETQRFIVMESEGRMLHAASDRQWKWQELEAVIPFQSQMTASVVNALLSGGSCNLTDYRSSVEHHLSLLDPLLAVVQQTVPETANFPFT